MQGRMALGAAGLLAVLSVPLPAVAEHRAPVAATCEPRPWVPSAAGAGLPDLPDRPASRRQLRYAPDWLAWSEVWVIGFDPAYGYAMVATPDREHLWILSRQPDIRPEAYKSLLARARALGFGTERLRRIPQRGGAAPAEGQSRRWLRTATGWRGGRHGPPDRGRLQAKWQT